MRKFAFIVLCAAALLVPAQTVLSLGLGNAALDAVTPDRFHPDPAVWATLETPGFTIATGPLTGFTQIANLITPFVSASDPNFNGVMTSQVWQDDIDGHLLFLYNVTNTSTGYTINFGNLQASFENVTEIWDAGIWDNDGSRNSAVYENGDVLQMSYIPGGGGEKSKLQFNWQHSSANNVYQGLAPGDPAQWFYAETDAVYFEICKATLQNGGEAVGGIRAYCPSLIPEPMTMLAVGMGLAGLGGYIRRRR